MISHYANQKIRGKSVGRCPTNEWLAVMRELETEGERTPAQTDPHPAVMEQSTPALLRKQAA